MANTLRLFPKHPRFPTCSLCNEPVELETSKTDEDGKAVHEECYALKLRTPADDPSKT